MFEFAVLSGAGQSDVRASGVSASGVSVSGVSVSSLGGTGEIELALRHQLGDLETLAALLSEAGRMLPAAQGGIWRGPARTVYLAALGLLLADIRAAESHVDEALLDTRRALSTVAGYGR